MCAANIYTATITECPSDDSILVRTNLELPSVMYVITDKFGHKYKNQVNVDGNGNFQIDLSLLPEQLLTRHSGVFILQIFDPSTSDCTPILFNFCDSEVDNIIDTVHFSMYKSMESEEAIIGCLCDEIPTEPIIP